MAMKNALLIILTGIVLYNVCISIYLGMELLELQDGYVQVESKQFSRNGFVKKNYVMPQLWGHETSLPTPQRLEALGKLATITAACPAHSVGLHSWSLMWASGALYPASPCLGSYELCFPITISGLPL